MYRFIPCLLLLLSVSVLSAQGGGRFERIKEAKEAHLIEYLELSDTEAATFLPVYWKHDMRLRKLKRENRPLLSAAPAMSEQAALAELQRRQQQRREYTELQAAAEAAYLEVLPATKVLLLEEAERSFQRKLIQHIRGNRPRNR